MKELSGQHSTYHWTSSDLPTYVQLLLTYLVESKATLKAAQSIFLKKWVSVHLGPIVRYEWDEWVL